MTIVFKDKDTHAEDDPGIKLLGTQLPVRLLFPHRMLEIGERLPITAPSGGFVCVGKPAPRGNGRGAPGGARAAAGQWTVVGSWSKPPSALL